MLVGMSTDALSETVTYAPFYYSLFCLFLLPSLLLVTRTSFFVQVKYNNHVMAGFIPSNEL